MLFSHIKSVRAVHIKGPITLGVCACHLDACTHARKHPHTSHGASAKQDKTVFKLPGLIVQSHEIPFHVAHKWIRQARKMSGLKNEHGNSFDKSRLCLTFPLRPAGSHQRNKGDIDGTHFASAQKLHFCCSWNPVTRHTAGTKSSCYVNPLYLRSFKPCI